MITTLIMGACINAGSLGFIIHHRINETTYWLWSNRPEIQYGELTTTQSEFVSNGSINLKIKYMGEKEDVLDSGRKVKVQLWKECE